MRIQAFEFMDIPQTPRFMRDSVVESLGNSLRWSGVYKNSTEVFESFCAELQSNTLLDLCSGSGEPATILLDALNRQGKKLPHFLLSDLFPVIHEMEKIVEKFPNNIQAIKTPLDASNVPDNHPHSARIVISAFHHFPPDLAKSILRDTARKGKPIFIIEPMTRNFNSFTKLAIFYFLANIINPFLSKKNRLLKGIFTYLFPLIPLMAMWDGLVSVMRMYTEEELTALTSSIDTNFQWEFKNIPVAWGGTISVFTGKPSM